MSELAVVKIDDIESNGNVRKKIGDTRDLEKSIRKVGILQAPLVTPNDEEGKYRLVAGHRRIHVARKIGLTELAVQIADLSEVEILEAQLGENMVRTDLTVTEQSQGVLALTDDHDQTQKDVAAAIGRSVKWVSGRRKIGKQPEWLLALVDDGKLSIEDLRGIKLPEGFDGEWVEKAIAESVAAYNAAHGIRSTVGDFIYEQAMEPVVAKIEELSEFGCAVLDEKGVHHTWRIVNPQASDGDSRFVKLPIKKHRTEPCHVVGIVREYDHSRGGNTPKLREWCKKPARHMTSGVSELKVPDADKIAKGKASEKALRDESRKAKDSRLETYRTAMDTKPKAAAIRELAVMGFLGRLTHYEKMADLGKLLGLEPAIKTVKSWEGKERKEKDWTKPVTAEIKRNPERVLIAAACLANDWELSQGSTPSREALAIQGYLKSLGLRVKRG